MTRDIMGRRMTNIDFPAIAGDVARRLFDEPNAALSKEHELRYGNNGSLAIYLKTGTWYDYEAKEGGLLLKLIERTVPGQHPIDWLKREGFIDCGPSDGGTVELHFDFRDENKKLLSQEVRVERRDTGKKVTVWQQRPDGNGGWIKNLDGVRRVLYRLPEVIGTSSSGSTVFVPEGPKKVDALVGLGLRATCNPMGAGKWQPEFNQFLRDQDVVILPDNDPPTKNKKTGGVLTHPDGRPRRTGIDHAEDVARNLKPVAKRVRVLLLPNLPKKGDVVDWLRVGGGTKEKLLELVDAVPDWKPSDNADPSAKLAEFVAYRPQHNYIFKPTGETWPARSVDAQVGQVSTEDGPMSASAWLDIHSPVEQMTWIPGEPALVKDKLVIDAGWISRPGSTVWNLYRPPVLVPVPGDVSLWRDHMTTLWGDEGARHLISYFAQRVQRPHEKINHALVLGGHQGIGKDTILEPVKRAVGTWNFKEVSPHQLLERWNDFYKAVILRINEAHDLGDFDRYALYDRLKAVEAVPPDTLRIDEKHIRQYYVFNVAGIIITTNHETDGLYLPADDRRHYVLWSETTKDNFDKSYWEKLWDWYEDGGIAHIAHHLATLDLSGFSAKAPPMKTEAFWNIVNSSITSEDVEMADVLEKLGSPKVVTVEMVKSKSEPGFESWLGDRKNSRLIPHRFAEAGYVRVRNPDAKNGAWLIHERRCMVYGKRELPLKQCYDEIKKMVLDQKLPQHDLF